MINSSDSLLYNLSYLSSVIHPVIILRLLEHRLFTPLFKKKSVTSNPPPAVNPIQINENKTPIVSITPNIGASALASIPTLPKLDPLKRQRNSLTKDSSSSTITDRSSLLTKFAHSTYDKHRKITKSGTSNTPISGIASTNSQLSTTNNLPITSPSSMSGINSNDLSLLTNNSNQPSTTRKWFWRNSDKNTQSNIPNDRNPLLQAIVETDTSTSINNNQLISNTSANVAGVGEIKLLEKELLNLPTFQLSDSQNPLLPSPTCLNYDFPTQFDQANMSINRQYSSSSSSSKQQSNGLYKSRIHDEGSASSFTENGVSGGSLLTTLNIPFVAVRTPSDDSNRSSSHNSSPSRCISSTDNRQQRSLSNTRMSVRETVKSLFRSSKTVDNMSSANNRSTNSSICQRNLSKLKTISPLMNNQLSHSQPIVTDLLINDNIHFESPLISHSEQTPLLDRRNESKNHNHTHDDNNNEHVRLNRQGLHLPLDTDGLHRSHSCTAGITIPSNNQDIDLSNGTSIIPTITSNLQANHSDVVSLLSSDSTVSSLSNYLSPQQPFLAQLSAPLQINSNGKNDLDKSQESLFSFSSPVQKQHSFKSLIMAATTKDPAAKQSNDVLFLIASWVLRSPEDFQGKILLKNINFFIVSLV
jgi:hypothetical protein